MQKKLVCGCASFVKKQMLLLILMKMMTIKKTISIQMMRNIIQTMKTNDL